MTKIRLIISLITIIVVGVVGTAFFYYAKGYRFDSKNIAFVPSGLLVLKSYPDGAQIFIDGELETATNATVSLAPGTYEITVKKEGYMPWSKDLTIEKEEVTQADAHLYKIAPSLSALTFSSAITPQISADFTKIAYAVPATLENISLDKEGLWVMETINLPLGFSREPRRVTDGDLSEAVWEWSPNSREIVLTMGKVSYLLDVGSFTPQVSRTSILLTTLTDTQEKWEKEKNIKSQSQLRGLPKEMIDLLSNKTSYFMFAPDENLILYAASESATLADNLIKPLPGSSTQTQERDVKPGRIYIYDIKEDRNFFIAQQEKIEENCNLNRYVLAISCNSTVSWFPTSRHLVLTESDKITILDYDGTNRQVVYSGSYVAPHAYPVVSTDRLLILTNLGANTNPPNIYSLSLK